MTTDNTAPDGECHRDIATEWIVNRPTNVSRQIDSLAEVIAAACRRAVEEANRANRVADVMEDCANDWKQQLATAVRARDELATIIRAAYLHQLGKLGPHDQRQLGRDLAKWGAVDHAARWARVDGK